MSNTYQQIVRIVIGCSFLLILIGVYESVYDVSLWGTVSDAVLSPMQDFNRQDIIAQPTPAPVEVALDNGCCEPTLTSDMQTNPTAVTPLDSVATDSLESRLSQYETVYWQDDFNNTSGWEPYFEIKGELPVYKYVNTAKPESAAVLKSDISYATSNATAWNGYDGGDYSFTLPGAPMRDASNDSMNDGNDGKFASLITPYLWDFNISQSMPAYPYLVDVSATTTLATGAMVLLDFAGDVNNVSAGSGIMVMIPMRQNYDIGYIGNSNDDLLVWEFNNNRLWQLGCTKRHQEGFNTIFPSQVRSRFVVDQTTLAMHITGNNTTDVQLKCARAFNGNSNVPRFLGIGSRFWTLEVPVPYTNVLRFHDIVVAQPDSALLNDSTYVFDGTVSEIRDILCDAWSEQSEDITLDDALRSRCFDTDTWVTDANPGATRVAWPDQTDITGRWQCGIQAPFANFEIRAEQDYAIISIAGLEYRVVATTQFDFPFMIVHSPYGYVQDGSSYKWHAEARIGDYMGSPSRTWYGMQINADGTLQPSWMNQACVRY
jgi:hypothetical protein